jgi:hypothetical protein
VVAAKQLIKEVLQLTVMDMLVLVAMAEPTQVAVEVMAEAITALVDLVWLL